MPETDVEKGGGLPVGAYLKSVRESRGLQLDQASRVTKIGKNYLAAIEEGHFEKLPSAAYIKGFLRLYAGFLSLSGDEVVQRYEAGLPTDARPQVETRQERTGAEIVERAKRSGHGRWVIPALLLAMVIAAALLFSEKEERPPRPTPQPPAAPAPAVVQPQLTSAAAPPGAPPAEMEPLPPVLPAQPDGGVILRLRFNQDTWLSITIDDSISQRYDLKAGDIIEWKGKRLFALDVGDGGAVEAEFNGRRMKTLGEPGKPAHVELKGE